MCRRVIDRQKPRIFLYRSTVRDAVIRRMSDHAKRVYEYANLCACTSADPTPTLLSLFFSLPCLMTDQTHAAPVVLKEKDVVQDNYDTEVSVCDTLAGRQLVFDFDWEMDDLDVCEPCFARVFFLVFQASVFQASVFLASVLSYPCSCVRVVVCS